MVSLSDYQEQVTALHTATYPHAPAFLTALHLWRSVRLFCESDPILQTACALTALQSHGNPPILPLPPTDKMAVVLEVAGSCELTPWRLLNDARSALGWDESVAGALYLTVQTAMQHPSVNLLELREVVGGSAYLAYQLADPGVTVWTRADARFFQMSIHNARAVAECLAGFIGQVLVNRGGSFIVPPPTWGKMDVQMLCRFHEAMLQCVQ